ncbi:hypothetical protein DdX_01122 [Ditylenchus destructor]|uniref:Uncharacterized protein n=1 Tax=Ditylenchus destructor TaxID=166010 RepID=A0AAD4RB03_9BILA|nr:hypothetical protein DdX_01122 [Ditylenchus destructor]
MHLGSDAHRLRCPQTQMHLGSDAHRLRCPHTQMHTDSDAPGADAPGVTDKGGVTDKVFILTKMLEAA